MNPGSKPPDDYTLDDLIADEKRQTKWILVIFLGAVLFVGGRSMFGPPQTDESPAPPAPVTSQR